MTHRFLDELWHDLANKPYKERGKLPTIAELEKSEWSPEFEQLMRNRLIMGAFRYGLLGDPTKPSYDRMSSIERRIKLYQNTGNTEHLVDIANLALVEFVEGNHPLKHFSSIDDEEHAKEE